MKTILTSMWPYLRPYRRTLALALGAMFAETVTALLAPWPLKVVFDRVLLVQHVGSVPAHVRLSLGPAQWTLLAILTAAAVLIALFNSLFSYLDTQLSEVCSQRAVFELRKALFAHLQKLSIAYHHSADTRLGDLLARLSGDIGALQTLAAEGVSSLVTNGMLLVFMVVVVAVMDWPMAIAAVALLLPMALYARRNTIVMKQAMRAARRQEGHVSAVMQESLSSVKLVQAYNREEHESGRLGEVSDLSLTANIRAATLLARLTPTISLMSAVGYALLIVLGVQQVVAGRLSPGGLLVLLSYVRVAQSPVRQLSKLSYSISKAQAGLERIDEVLAIEPAVVSRPGATDLRIDGPAAVSFRHVGFGYSAGRPVLEDVSLDAAPGQLVALVGATGSGKSSLLSLLPRFYDPWTGTVMVQGRDVRDYTVSSLRANVAVVLQDSLIFRTTVLENIAYGRPEATREEIIAAARLAGVAQVAERLEHGYDTVVSERGASLSGGEKQCIGIARAVLKDAPIVVLDEPTSAMDAHTERLVMQGIERLLAGRTGFIIAHRLATVMKADVVAVLDGGRVVESGNPRALLADPASRFSALARAQLIREDRQEQALPQSDPVARVIPRGLRALRAGPLRAQSHGRT